MGPIQSSLNQLTLGLLGAVAGVAKGVKGGFEEPKAPGQPKVKPAKAETGKKATYALQTPKTSEYATYSALQSGNDMIKQKARASSRTFNKRLSMIRKRKMGR